MMKKYIVIGIAGGMLTSSAVWAQEVDRFSAPNTVGVGMAKGLHEQIGGGRGSINTPGSSRFLIARDPARAIRRGRNLFQRKFKHSEGAGPRTGDGEGNIDTDGSIGAGLADSCALCHGRPRGSAGFGGDVFTRPDSRDAPHLFGLGLQEQLADEITAELRQIRDDAIDQALNGGGSSLTTGQAEILGFEDVADWSLVTGGAIVANGTASEGSQSLAVTTSGGWTQIESAPLTGLDLSGTVSYDVFVPSAPPGWAEASVAIISSGITGFTELTPRVNLSTLPVGQFSNVSFSIPGGLLSQLNQPGVTLTVAVILNAPNLAQPYLIDNLAMTAPSGPGPVTVPLNAKGVNYGTLSVDAAGVVDTSGVEGVDSDLRVRPFFAEGTTVSMREFAVGAFNAEMGIQITDPDIDTAAAGGTVITPSGMVLDGTLDTFESSPLPETTDPSALEPTSPLMSNSDAGATLIDFMEFYLLNYFKPGHYEETSESALGRATFNQIGCNNCHKANMTIESDRRVADVETEYDPVNGLFNNLFATAATRFDIVPDGGAGGFPEQPFLLPSGDPFVVEDIFTDFKRHDLGSALHERNFDGTIHTTFITEPLWGVGSSAPYGHDGRSINLQEIILRHGGEALAERQAYEALSAEQQGWVKDFLNTLVLFPPDDTASNLNAPGEINPADPQNAHGNIKLPALFQVASEGPE